MRLLKIVLLKMLKLFMCNVSAEYSRNIPDTQMNSTLLKYRYVMGGYTSRMKCIDLKKMSQRTAS